MDKNKITKKELVESINTLFSKADPVSEIHTMLKDLLNHGNDKELVQSYLGEYRLELQREGKEKEEEVIVDVLTFFIGWSSDEWKL